MSNQKKAAATILVVEDDEESKELLKEFLKGYKYQVIAVADEQQVMDAAEDSALAADLILLDQRRTNAEVLALGQRIRLQMNQEAEVPVVVIACEYIDEMEGKDEQVGASDWVTYMASNEQLGSLLRRLLA